MIGFSLLLCSVPERALADGDGGVDGLLAEVAVLAQRRADRRVQAQVHAHQERSREVARRGQGGRDLEKGGRKNGMALRGREVSELLQQGVVLLSFQFIDGN